MPKLQVRPVWRNPLQVLLRGSLVGLVLASVIASGSAAAQATRSVRFLSAGALYERLASTDPAAVEAGRHYVMGVLDTLLLTRDPQVCLGAEVRLDFLVGLVRDELASRPQAHRFNAGSFVREVMHARLKCS
jgi:hypothetical protein